MSQHDYSGCPRNDPIAAMDMHGCMKYGVEIWGGSRGRGQTRESDFHLFLLKSPIARAICWTSARTIRNLIPFEGQITSCTLCGGCCTLETVQKLKPAFNDNVDPKWELYLKIELFIVVLWCQKKKGFWGVVVASVTRLGDFLDLDNFSKPLATINLPNSPTFLGNFCKGVKNYHFSSEIIFGQLL